MVVLGVPNKFHYTDFTPLTPLKRRTTPLIPLKWRTKPEITFEKVQFVIHTCFGKKMKIYIIFLGLFNKIRGHQRWFLILFLVLFTITKDFGQNKRDTVFANKILQRTNENISKVNFEKELNDLNVAAKIFEKTKLWSKYYDCHLAIYNLAKNENKYGRIIDDIKRGANQVPSSEFYVKAKTNFLCAYVYAEKGDIFLALESYNLALTSFLHTNDSTRIFKTYGNIGIIYIQLRDYQKATIYLTQAVNLATKIKDLSGITRNLKLLGEAYIYSGQTNLGRSLLDKAKMNYASDDGSFAYDYAMSFFLDKEYHKALPYIKEAIRKKSGNVKDADLYACYSLLGQIYSESQDHTKALPNFSKAYQGLPFIQNKREVAKILYGIAQAKYASKHYDETLDYLDEAIKRISNQSSLQINNERILLQDAYIFDFYTLKAKCNFEKYQSSCNLMYLTEADRLYALCFKNMEVLKKYVDDGYARNELNAQAKKVYDEGIALKIQLFEITSESKYLEAAFLLVQQYNAYNLRTQVSEREVLDLYVNDPQIKKRYLKAKILLLNSRFRINHETSDSLFNEYLRFKKEFEQLSDTLSRKYKRFASNNAPKKIITLKEVSNKINKGTTFISYYAGIETIYAFCISEKDLYYFSFSNNEKFKSDMQTYLNLLSGFETTKANAANKETQFLETSKRLYTKLLLNVKTKSKGRGGKSRDSARWSIVQNAL